MFIPKSVSVLAERETIKDIDETFKEYYQSGKMKDNLFSRSYNPYLCMDENAYNELRLYLESNEIFFEVEDYCPEKELIRRINDITCDDRCFDEWKASSKYGNDIVLYKGNADAAYIHITDEPFEFYEDTLKTARVSFNKAVCTEADMYGILEGVIENYGCTALTKQQEEFLVRNGYDFNGQVLDLGNGFIEQMKADTHIEVLLNSGICSFDGSWQSKDEIGREWAKYTRDMPTMTNAVIMRIDEKNDDDERLVGYCLTEIYCTKNKAMNYSTPLRKIKTNLSTAMPYVFKAYNHYNTDLACEEPVVEDITESFTADYPTADYFRKFHLSFTLPDGNIFKGFINVKTGTREELPEKEEMTGEFVVERLSLGWVSRVVYDDEERNNDKRFGETVVVNGIYEPETEPQGNINSTAQAEQILKSVFPIKLGMYDKIPRFKGRIEEHIYSVETDMFEDKYNIQKNERNMRMKNIER